MPSFDVEIQATATSTITVEADSEEEAKEIAEIDGFEISDTNELSDFEVTEVKPSRVFGRKATPAELAQIKKGTQ